MEDKNQSTENQDLAQAPPAGETVPETTIPEDVAVKKFTALRHRAQDAEVQLAKAEGIIEGMKQSAAKDTPPPVSPVDAEIARQVKEGIDADDVVISAPLYRRQKQYEAQVANQEAETRAGESLIAAQDKSIAAARMVHDDLDAVIKEGERHLTKGELLDIKGAGDGYAIEAYTKCKAAIERAKPKTDNAAQETSKPKSEAAPKTVPTQDEILEAVGEVDPMTAHAASL